jgi:phosphate/sulfate permease
LRAPIAKEKLCAKERERERKKIPTTRFGLLRFLEDEEDEEDEDVARLDVHEQIHAARRKRTRGASSKTIMLSSSSRKERKERKERKKREKKDVLDGVSDATGSSVVSSEGTHDSAQTTGMVSPVGKADSSEMQSTEAANVSGESTTTGSTAAREDAERKKKTQSTSTEKKESLVQKSWFRVVAGAACSIAILSTGTKLLMNKEEKVEVKEDVATPAAGKKKKK